jgi:hypothetical protein
MRRWNVERGDLWSGLERGVVVCVGGSGCLPRSFLSRRSSACSCLSLLIVFLLLS